MAFRLPNRSETVKKRTTKNRMVGNAAFHRLRNCAAKALHIPQKSTLFHSLRLFSHYTPIPPACKLIRLTAPQRFGRMDRGQKGAHVMTECISEGLYRIPVPLPGQPSPGTEQLPAPRAGAQPAYRYRLPAGGGPPRSVCRAGGAGCGPRGCRCGPHPSPLRPLRPGPGGRWGNRLDLRQRARPGLSGAAGGH